ncbi:hypothetical protein GYMLUDRAFT_1022062 [Collybiopsis luxurians FD-317 M1]|uniref:Uncharacterized protein n=1 Tax=Collybiopsis luxurians FD-317 M1 TaxID=944289 RepID=A0A0D0BY39_9AGAR|nr:hypothetical protein GYMLUDRAFT_1022062 [Collybiopsis luxurians FD-317 M1]
MRCLDSEWEIPILAPQEGSSKPRDYTVIQKACQQEWLGYKQHVVDIWSQYTDANGNPLNIRPYWAKEWQGLTVRGKDVIMYLQEDTYPNEIQEFAARLRSHGNDFPIRCLNSLFLELDGNLKLEGSRMVKALSIKVLLQFTTQDQNKPAPLKEKKYIELKVLTGQKSMIAMR